MKKKQKIHLLFETQVARIPERIALKEGNCSMSYQTLNMHANQLAHHLKAHGLKDGQTVALCLARSQAFIIALLAIIKAGGTYLPLDPNQPTDRLNFILEDCQASLLITDLPTQKKLTAYQGICIIPANEDDLIQTYPVDNPSVTSQKDNIAKR